MRNFFNAPSACAQDEGVTGALLKHHLFIQLAYADGLAAGTRQKNSVQAAVRDGAAIQDGNLFDALPRGQPVSR